MDKWNDFIEKHKKDAINCLHKKYSTLDGEDLKEVYNDSLYAMHKNIVEGKVAGPIYPYFLRICINLSQKKVCQKSKHVVVGINDTDIKQKHAVSQRSVEEVLRICQEEDMIERESSERKSKLVRSILDSMTPKCKELLWHYYAEDLNWATVASITGYSNADSAKMSGNRCRKTFIEKYDQLIYRIYGKKRTHR